MSIELNEDQKKKQAECMGYIHAIEKSMSTVIDHTEGENISYCLNERIALLATCPKMMEIATAIYDFAKGEAANEAITNDKIFGAKQSIQIKWFDGKLAKWNGLFTRADRCHKDLDTSIRGLITLLSRDKALINQSNFGNNSPNKWDKNVPS